MYKYRTMNLVVLCIIIHKYLMSGRMGFFSGRSLHGVTVHTGCILYTILLHFSQDSGNSDHFGKLLRILMRTFLGRNVRSLEALLELIKGGYR